MQDHICNTTTSAAFISSVLDADILIRLTLLIQMKTDALMQDWRSINASFHWACVFYLIHTNLLWGGGLTKVYEFSMDFAEPDVIFQFVYLQVQYSNHGRSPATLCWSLMSL